MSSKHSNTWLSVSVYFLNIYIRMAMKSRLQFFFLVRDIQIVNAVVLIEIDSLSKQHADDKIKFSK